MTHLGSLSGTGQVRIGEEHVGVVRYTIHVYATPHLKDGQGTIEADSSVLNRIMNADTKATLELEDGGTVEILISNWDVLDDRADIATSGPIPGF